jgi:hypothetical protein
VLQALDGETILDSYGYESGAIGLCVTLVQGVWDIDVSCDLLHVGVCAIPPRGTPAPGTCGDGHVDAGEECDAPGKIGCVGCQVVCEGPPM